MVKEVVLFEGKGGVGEGMGGNMEIYGRNWGMRRWMKVE